MSERRGESVGVYICVFVGLLLLLIATLIADRFQLGIGNLVIGIAIAITKAVLIAAFFMHLRGSTSLIRLAALTPVIWIVVLFTLTFADYTTRGWQEPGQELQQQLPNSFDRVEPN